MSMLPTSQSLPIQGAGEPQFWGPFCLLEIQNKTVPDKTHSHQCFYLPQGWTAGFSLLGWLSGIKIFKQITIYLKCVLLSCFTQSTPVSKTRSSLVNITVQLWLPRLNTISSWASSICFSYHSDLAWTGTSGSVVRSCKYPASEPSLEFLVFAEYSFSNLSAQPTV